jgi:hypothetical protein
MADLSHTFPNDRTVTLRGKTVTLHPEHPACVRICGTEAEARAKFWQLCWAVSREEGNDRRSHWIPDDLGEIRHVYSGETQIIVGPHKDGLEVCLPNGDDVFIPRAVALAVLGITRAGFEEYRND